MGTCSFICFIFNFCLALFALLFLVPSCLFFFSSTKKEFGLLTDSNNVSFSPNTTQESIQFAYDFSTNSIFNITPFFQFLLTTAPSNTAINVTIHENSLITSPLLQNCSANASKSCVVWLPPYYPNATVFITLDSTLIDTTIVKWERFYLGILFLVSTVVLCCSGCLFLTFFCFCCICCLSCYCDETIGNHKGAKFVAPHVSYRRRSHRKPSTMNTVNRQSDRDPLVQQTETGYVDGVKVTKHYSAVDNNRRSQPFVEDNSHPFS